MKNKTVKIVLISLLLISSYVASIVLLYPFIIKFYLHSERTFTPQPEIDTVFAESFSKEKFESITTGMRSEEVEGLLGEPLGYDAGQKILFEDGYEVRKPQNNSECWRYSKDGALTDADFSWFLYRICFENNQVYLKSVQEYHD